MSLYVRYVWLMNHRAHLRHECDFYLVLVGHKGDEEYQRLERALTVADHYYHILSRI